MYDFFITLMGIAMNVPLSIVCASCIYTNVPDAGQHQLLFPTSILLMCQEGSLYILEKSNQKKHRLGMSPLYMFTKKTQDEMSKQCKEEAEEKILEINKGDSSGTNFISSEFELKNSSGTELHRITNSTSNFNMQMEVRVEEQLEVREQPTEEEPEVRAQPTAEQPEVREQPTEEQPEVRAQPTAEQPEVCAQPTEEQPEVRAPTSEVNPEAHAQTPAVKEEKVQISSTLDDTRMYDSDSDNDAENCAKTGICDEINVGIVVNAFINTPVQSHDESSLDACEADIKLRLSRMSEIEASILIDSEKYKEENGSDANPQQQTELTTTVEDNGIEAVHQKPIANINSDTWDGSETEPEQDISNIHTDQEDGSEAEPEQDISNIHTDPEDGSEAEPEQDIANIDTDPENGLEAEPKQQKENPDTSNLDTAEERDQNIDNLVPPSQPIVNSATGQENDVETQPPTEINIMQANVEDGVQLEPTEANPDTSNLDTAEERDQNIDNLVPPSQPIVNSATGQENDV